MYKLVAIDLDGTLLNSYGQISEKNKQVIKQAIANGIQIVLASGRPVMSVKNLATELGADNYIICGNGSILYDLKKEEILYNKFIEKKKVLEIIKICEENSIYYNVYTENAILAKSLNYNVLFYHQENAKKTDEQKTNINIVQDIYKYVEEHEEQKYLKITICDENQIIFNGIVKKLKEIKNIDVLDVVHMSSKIIKHGTEDISIEYLYTEITNKNVNKWEAIKYLIDKLNIKDEEVIAIGDNVNDVQMIKNAGVGVVMGNSAPYIKEIGDIIVADNNSDGVAEAIEKLC